MGDFNIHAPFLENGCTSVTCHRVVDNIVDSGLCVLNDGRITKSPDVSTYKETTIGPVIACILVQNAGSRKLFPVCGSSQ